MIATIDNIKGMLNTLKISHSASALEKILELSNEKGLSYEKFLENLLEHEIKSRSEKKIEQRLKQALFPEYKTIDEFDLAEQQSLSRRQLNQLLEFTWIEQGFNLIMLGPPGVGKTHLAIGLGIHAIHSGYKVIFTTMNDLIYYLKTQEILRSAQTRLKRITEADLVIIDDLMFMAMEKHEANLFFQLINKLYGQTSIIITSNKGPEDWGELLGDPAITTAILDRIVHKCEVINLCGDSYRLKYRTSIFGKN
ncbi:DNA replication protein DnaC [Anaerobranca gottschalkii DSM 13577]|uniref:DNA replication protein DnaC n=1 Tax=Anaerobranca gottschalkii DSM 13577 TaxID=1120990 RepID=A0A1I0BN32_9FIRM|nr:DNA replication protein DnaC [Anaerobranca gottschalkii DSM 13577]SET14268.1 DNA replication protein DnaC [Anaerobranca gottschalkii DSM 13577]